MAALLLERLLSEAETELVLPALEDLETEKNETRLVKVKKQKSFKI